jgi:hypothetical protein
MDFGVYCECGQVVAVAEGDAGSARNCPCGRRVVVPLLDEFRDRPVLLSAATIERRVRRLIAAGELPLIDWCLNCGEVGTAGVVNLQLDCERASTRTSGGRRFLILPFFSLTWHEEVRVEIHGRDTLLEAPVALCQGCRPHLARPPAWRSFLVAAGLLVLSGFLAYCDVLIGVSVMTIGLALFAGQRYLAERRRQRGLKEMLRRVPAYRQILDRYRYAVVLLPRAR